MDTMITPKIIREVIKKRNQTIHRKCQYKYEGQGFNTKGEFKSTLFFVIVM